MVIDSVKVQKSTKDITKSVHLIIVVQLNFYEASRVLYLIKRNQNNNLNQHFLLSRESLARHKTMRTQVARKHRGAPMNALQRLTGRRRIC